MSTILVSGKRPLRHDESLIAALGSLAQAQRLPAQCPIAFGIENEEGEIYRIVGVGDVRSYVDAIDRLRELGYRVESLEFECAGDLHAAVKPPSSIEE